MQLRGRVSSFFVFTLLALAPSVYGQVDRANINGTVTDASGGLVPDTDVVLSSAETGFRRQVETGSTGAYSITSVPVGTYYLTFSRKGFQTSTVKDIQLF